MRTGALCEEMVCLALNALTAAQRRCADDSRGSDYSLEKAGQMLGFGGQIFMLQGPCPPPLH